MPRSDDRVLPNAELDEILWLTRLTEVECRICLIDCLERALAQAERGEWDA